MDTINPAPQPLIGVVKGAIMAGDKCLFLVKPDGRLDLAGGSVNPGETPLGALIREAKEETNLVVRPVRFSHFWSFTGKEERRVQGATYYCQYISGQLRLSLEHVGHYWFSIADLAGGLGCPLAAAMPAIFPNCDHKRGGGRNICASELI